MGSWIRSCLMTSVPCSCQKMWSVKSLEEVGWVRDLRKLWWFVILMKGNEKDSWKGTIKEYLRAQWRLQMINLYWILTMQLCGFSLASSMCVEVEKADRHIVYWDWGLADKAQGREEKERAQWEASSQISPVGSDRIGTEDGNINTFRGCSFCNP